MDISYEKTLTSLMFFNKVDTGEDYSVELEEIKTWTEDEKQLIASDLFDRAAEYTDKSGQYIDALQELDFVDERMRLIWNGCCLTAMGLKLIMRRQPRRSKNLQRVKPMKNPSTKDFSGRRWLLSRSAAGTARFWFR